MSRFDRFRSLVRRAGDRAGKALESSPLAGARQLIAGLAERKTRIPDVMLTKAVARAQGVEQASVSCEDGRIHIDIAFAGGEMLQFAMLPWQARFAPRGAKEVVFRVEPAELAQKSAVREVVAGVAAAIAHALWALPLGVSSPIDSAGTIVDVEDLDGNEEWDIVRVDLRTIPAVREMMKRSSSAAVVDTLGVSEMIPEDGGLSLRLAIPGLT